MNIWRICERIAICEIGKRTDAALIQRVCLIQTSFKIQDVKIALFNRWGEESLSWSASENKISIELFFEPQFKLAWQKFSLCSIKSKRKRKCILKTWMKQASTRAILIVFQIYSSYIQIS